MLFDGLWWQKTCFFPHLYSPAPLHRSTSYSLGTQLAKSMTPCQLLYCGDNWHNDKSCCTAGACYSKWLKKSERDVCTVPILALRWTFIGARCYSGLSTDSYFQCSENEKRLSLPDRRPQPYPPVAMSSYWNAQSEWADTALFVWTLLNRKEWSVIMLGVLVAFCHLSFYLSLPLSHYLSICIPLTHKHTQTHTLYIQKSFPSDKHNVKQYVLKPQQIVQVQTKGSQAWTYKPVQCNWKHRALQ